MKDFVHGSISGAAGVIVGHPFDTIKVRLQTQDSKNPVYKSNMDCARKILQKEGMRGFLRGVASPVAGVGVSNAIVFGVHANAISRCQTKSLRNEFACGSLAGFAQSFVTSPLELVKTRLQVHSAAAGTKYSTATQCLKYILKNEGFKGMFRGQLATIAREIPGFGTYFATFTYCTQKFTREDAPAWEAMSVIFMAGGFAGMASWGVNYPIDVIKTRMQSDGANGIYRYSSYGHLVKDSIKEDGVKCFSRGFTSTLMRAFPSNAAIFFTANLLTRLSEHEVETPTNLMEDLQLDIKQGADILMQNSANGYKGYFTQSDQLLTVSTNHLQDFHPLIREKTANTISQLANNLENCIYNGKNILGIGTQAAIDAFLSGYSMVEPEEEAWMFSRWLLRLVATNAPVSYFKLTELQQ